jgi:tyrosyl-tRNA synthetase
MIYKKKLAFHLTRMLNSEKEAKKAQEYFETTYQRRQLPTDIPTVKLTTASLTLAELLIAAKLAKSKSGAKRLIGEKAVEINGKAITNPQEIIDIKEGIIIRAGKHRFAKILST